MPEVRAGQVYLLPDGCEIYVRTNPEMGTVRGRQVLSVETVAERSNRSSVERFAGLELIDEGRCFKCWYTGSHEGHQPPEWAAADHEHHRQYGESFKARLEARRAAKRAAAAHEGDTER